MTFENLKTHLEEEGCTFQNTSDPQLFLVTNTIMLEECYIENLEFYKIESLCYYIWKLKIEVPNQIEDVYEVYSNIYNSLN